MTMAVLQSSTFRPPSSLVSAPLSTPEDDTTLLEMDSSPLEIVFSFNIAGSYGPFPQITKKYIKSFVRCMTPELLRQVVSLYPAGPTRVAVFAHGLHDRDMSSFQCLDFTEDVEEVCCFVDGLKPLSWGSVRHCYELVLRRARSLSWTPRSKRALVMVGCSKCHYGPHADSPELIHWHLEARCLAQMAVAVYTVEVQAQYYDWDVESNGCHVILEQHTNLSDVLHAIVCHLARPEVLEELEDEIMARGEDHYTTDIAQLFVTLRQHQVEQKTLAGNLDPDPGTATPQGSDFGDEDTVTSNQPGKSAHIASSDPDSKMDDSFHKTSNQLGNSAHVVGPDSGVSINIDGSDSFHKVKTVAGPSTLIRRTSSRLKGKQPSDTSVTRESKAGFSTALDHAKLPSPVPRLKRYSTSAMARSRRAKDRKCSGQSVSFYLEDGNDEEAASSSGKTVSSAKSVLEDFHDIKALALKKSNTVSFPLRGAKQMDNRECAGGFRGLEEKRKKGESHSLSRNSPRLRKGVTNIGFFAEEGSAGKMEEFLASGSCDAKVYKIDREAPVKREDVLPGNFTLKHLSWSPWQLVVSPEQPKSGRNQWQPCEGGYRRKVIESNDRAVIGPALYEIALKREEETRKRVVFYKFLPRLDKSRPWEGQLLDKEGTGEEMKEAVRRKCRVFLRLAPLSQTAGKGREIMQAALHKYDYAWNDVQGLTRSVRRVEFLQ